MEFICLRVAIARSSGRNCALAAPGGSRNEYEFICQGRDQPRSQGLSSSHKREWSKTPSCGKTKDPGNEVGKRPSLGMHMYSVSRVSSISSPEFSGSSVSGRSPATHRRRRRSRRTLGLRLASRPFWCCLVRTLSKFYVFVSGRHCRYFEGKFRSLAVLFYALLN